MMSIFAVRTCNKHVVLRKAASDGSYEQFYIGEREHGWMQHSLGLEQLMSMRGPASLC